MGKRFERIQNKNLVSNLGKIKGKEVNITLQDGGVLHAYILNATPEKIFAQDIRNHKHHLMLSEISEVVLDIVSEN